MTVALSVAILFLGSALLPFFARAGRNAAALAAGATMALSFALLVPSLGSVGAGRPVVQSMSWLDEWGLTLSFRFDGLGLLFSLLILGIGLMIVLYAAYYLPKKDGMGRFYGFLLAFAGGMLGMVLSENILLMLVFWEITSITSFLLIAYKYEYHEGRIGARMALAVTGGGGLALLAGLLLLGRIAGSYEFSTILASGDLIRAHPLYPVTLVLILLGAFTKSAQFPFHFWLPNAMAAPTPVSAYLHSATMVKAGIFLVARMYPALSGTDLWFYLVAGSGAVTMAYAAYIAILKHDLKGLLAYSTVSHLGLIMMLFGLNTPMTAIAGLFHIINHAAFKAALFMSAGIIDHETGTRDMRRMGGLFALMPITGTLAILAAASMAGVPLLNGFLSKEMFFTEAATYPGPESLRLVLTVFATVAGLLSVAYSVRFIHDVFFNGAPRSLPQEPHEPPFFMRAPVMIFVVICIAIGLFPQLAVGNFLTIVAQAVLPGPVPEYKLAIWHGFNLPLAMSAIAMGGGILWYMNRQFLFHLHDTYAPNVASPVAFERVYNWSARGSSWLMDRIDPGSLQRYLALLFAFTLGLGFYAYRGATVSTIAGTTPSTPLDVPSVVAFSILAMGALGIVFQHKRRLLSVVYLSVVGLIVSLTFLRFSAPDLALTQLSVEVVSTALLLLALRYLPAERTDRAGTGRLARDAALAGLAGLGAGALVYAMLTRPFETISNYFLANSYVGGGGTNVVNVILVDFRGFDTLGEIAVLALAALGAHAALQGLRLLPGRTEPVAPADRHPIMLAMLIRPLLPLSLVVAAFIFLRGHNLPGGGFIAGLVAGVALILQYLGGGMDFARERMRFDQTRLLAAGLFFAAGIGVASFAFGAPFLTSTFGYVGIPLVGKTELASAMIFDLGVFLVVVGTVLLILSELGALSRRDLSSAAPRAAQQRETV